MLAALLTLCLAANPPAVGHSSTDTEATLRLPGLQKPVVVFHLADAHVSVRDPAEEAVWQYSARMDEGYGTPRAHYQTKAKALPAERLRELLAAARAAHVDLIALTGDIINNPSASSVRYVAQALRGTGLRSLYVSGNHDWHYEGLPGSEEALRAEWTRQRLLPLYEGRNPLCSAMQVGGINFVAIDNSTYQVSPAQLAFFRQELARGLPTVLLVHIPLYTGKAPGVKHVSACGDPDWGWDADVSYKIERRERWSKSGNLPSTVEFVALARKTSNLIAVLAGHTHRPKAETLSASAVQYVARAACEGGFRLVRFEPATSATAPASALWVEGETWFSQRGSTASDRPPFASRGECLGSGWGGQRGHETVYRFELDRELPAATLHLRYARRDAGPAVLDLLLNGKPVVRAWKLSSTGGWGHKGDQEWHYATATLGKLTAGWHVLKLASAAQKNNVNLDGFFLAAADFTPPTARRALEACRPARVMRGPDAPGPDCVAEGLTLEKFSGQLDDWYYPAEEPRERAAVKIPRLVSAAGDRATLADGQAKGREVAVGQTFGSWRLAAVLPGAEPMAVVEREFDRWGLLVYVGTKGPVAEVRKAVGRLDKIVRPQIRFPADYFDRLVDAKADLLGDKVLAGGAEPTFRSLAGYLAPLETYTFLGTPASGDKFIVYPDGTLGNDPNRSRAPRPEQVIFDPAQVLPPLEATQSKRGLLGGYLPAIDYGFFDPLQQQGYELCALADPRGAGVLVRVRCHDGQIRYGRTPGMRPATAAEFFAALLKSRRDWDQFFAAGMRLEIGDRRAFDVARGCIVRAVSGLPGDHPKYGMGGYWGKPEHHDGFPPTTLSLCQCLLDWGFAEEVERRLGYYLDRYVKPDGTVRYYGPAVAEYGQFLDLAAACAQRTGDAQWFAAHRPALERMAGYLVGLLVAARQQPADALTFGLIQGSAEADTASDQRFYFSGNAWCWRGLYELARFYVEQGRRTGDASLTAAGNRWLAECRHLQRDLARAVAGSVIQARRFVPPVAGQTTVFERMTEDRLASYTNYRYWLETLSARALTMDEERMTLDYHQAYGGELLGTIRFAGHLDDWPFYHQAWGTLMHDRVERYLLGYWAHVAHHQTQGTFTAYEQVPIRGWRTRREMADYCIPSELTAPLMTRWMLVFEERDADVLWLGRAIPRAWLAEPVVVDGALTRWGPVGFTLRPADGKRQMQAEIRLPAGARPTVVLRVRHPDARPLVECRVVGARCESLDAGGELVRLRPQGDRITLTLLYRP
jgi:predicted phosphodiesterase